MEAELALNKYRKQHSIDLLPEMAGERVIEEVKAEYARLQALLANYTERYTGEHPKMVELKAQIKSLGNKIHGLEDIDVGGKTMEYRVLEREVQTNKRMHEILLARMKEIDLSSNLDVNNISIVDKAEVPKKPVKPKLLLNMFLAVTVGLVGGSGLGFFIDYLDTTIKSPEDIKDVLGLNFLGAVPGMEEESELKKDKIADLEPHSIIAESYRAIRTEVCRLMTQNKSQRSVRAIQAEICQPIFWSENLKTILITSAEPQAGKTTTASNLGIVLAQNGSRVLLVDADLRKPQLHRIFKLERNKGITDCLEKKLGIDSVIKNTEIKNLKVITSGKSSSNPAEILNSSKMEEFVRDLKDRFDFIIFDSPPIISVADSIILAEKIDTLIQVVRSGKALVPIAINAKERLENTRAKILGVVLNDLNVHHGNYYYYHYYKYYHHYYGKDDRRRSSKGSSRRPKKRATKPLELLKGTIEALKFNSRKTILLIKDRLNTHRNNEPKKGDEE